MREQKTRDFRNCRCCLSIYEKPEGFWCQMSMQKKDGSVVEPKGFCEFCDRKNKTWYVPGKKCHAKQADKNKNS